MSGDVARTFHEQTKHHPETINTTGRVLEMDNKPDPFKSYDVELERDRPEPGLARVLHLGGGVIRKAMYGSATFFFRTYASAGALYPVEVYVLDDTGVWHFDPLRGEIERLREGDFGPRTIVLTGIPWRTCWKYGDRGYRHLFWDAGTILANMLAVLADQGVSARVVTGFDDDRLARLIDVDGLREFPLAVVELDGRAMTSVELPPLGLPVRALSPREERFPLIEEVHAAGRLRAEDVDPWRGSHETADPPAAPLADVDAVIRRRGSARKLGPGRVPVRLLEDVLRSGAAPVATDHGRWFVRLFVAVHAVDGLEPGTYVYADGHLRPQRLRDVRVDAQFLCLGQRLAADGAATVFLMADIERALNDMGDRGYRAAQLEGGLGLGRLDLAAHAHGLGSTGLTFFDDEVTRFFSPEATGTDCIVVCAIGERLTRPLPLM